MSSSVAIATGSGGDGGGGEEEEEDILVIPHLGDSGIESDVQALLGSHGIRTRRAVRGSLSHEDEDEEEEERDEDGDDGGGDTSARVDYEYTPTRTGFFGTSRGRGRRGGRRRRRSSGGDEMELDGVESECSSCAPSRPTSPSPSPTITLGGGGRVTSPPPLALRRGSLTPPRTASLFVQQQQFQMTYAEHLDIAGTCFDPSGRFIYVGATEAVVEWGIRGSEKRWWSGAQWR